MQHSFHEDLKKSRKEAGITQQGIADLMKIDIRTYQHWEKDVLPSVENILILNKKLKTNLFTAFITVNSGQPDQLKAPTLPSVLIKIQELASLAKKIEEENRAKPTLESSMENLRIMKERISGSMSNKGKSGKG